MAAATEPVVLDAETLKGRYIGLQVEYLEDKDHRFTITDVTGPELDRRFVQWTRQSIGFGYTTARYWLRFTVSNPGKNQVDWYLESEFPNNRLITLFVLKKGRLAWSKTIDFYSTPADKREIHNLNAVFPVSQEPGTLTCYISVISDAVLSCPLRVWNIRSLMEKTNRNTGALYFFYGIILIMAIYNLFIFFSVRERAYLYYVFQLLSLACLYMAMDSIGQNYIYPGLLSIYHFAYPTFLLLTTILCTLFAQSYLETRKNTPCLHRMLNIFIGIELVLFLVQFVMRNLLFYQVILNIVFIEILLFVFVVGPRYFMIKPRLAAFFFSAYIFFLSGSVVRMLKDIGILQSVFVTHFSPHIGSLCMVVLFSLALADRINRIKNELQNLNAHLEEIVDSRTRALTMAMGDLESAYARLKDLDIAKSNFFANISHEFRTPLTLILSPVESALQGDIQSPSGDDFLINIHRNAIRLLKLVNNLLDFSKIEAGRMYMRIQAIDLIRFLKNHVAGIHSAAELKGVRLIVEHTMHTVDIFGDIEKVETIFMNLFSNALKFTDRGDCIRITVTDDPAACTIIVADTGEGIPSDKIDTIFNRFSQADTGSTRRHQGTGIGLALAKELIEMHGGSISVSSKFYVDHPQGHGTSFTLVFPKGIDHYQGRDGIEFVSDSRVVESVSDFSQFSGMLSMKDLAPDGAVNAPIDSANSAPARQGIRKRNNRAHILIIDDNQDMRSFLMLLLKDHYTLDFAVNGRDGLEKMRKLLPDLAITDVMMPEMNGYELTRALKADEALRHIPVLMLTAKAEVTNKIEGLEYGADDYLTKPFNARELLTRIRTLLKAHEYQKIIVERNTAIEDELEIARLIQQKLLPQHIPEVSGYRSHVACIPVDKVGGDFYDYHFRERSSSIELFIADVSGHGVSGAFLALITKMAYDALPERESPSRVLYLLNDVINRATVKYNYVSGFFCLINTKNNIIRFCNGGHFPPFVYRRKTRQFFELNSKGSVLGWFKTLTLTEAEFQLEAGDRLLIYTDGITECMNQDNQMFGEERFREFIRANSDLSPASFTAQLLERLKSFKGSTILDDDMTLIVVDVL